MTIDTTCRYRKGTHLSMWLKVSLPLHKYQHRKFQPQGMGWRAAAQLGHVNGCVLGELVGCRDRKKGTRNPQGNVALRLSN